MNLIRPARLSAAVGFVLVCAGCASVAVTDDAIQRNTAATLGVDPSALNITNRENDGVKTTYVAKTSAGRTYNCYVTGSVSVIGRVVSDAVCTELIGAAGKPAAKPANAASCNALLKAAGKC